MSSSLETDQDTCCDVVGQHPVPDGRSASLVVCLREHILGGLEAIRLRDSNGQPDQVQDEVEQDQVCRNTKDPTIDLGIAVVHSNAQEQNDFGDDPLDHAEMNVIHVGRVCESENADLGEEEVRGGL